MLPPRWGREGVTLIAFFKRMESDRSSTEQKKENQYGNVFLYPRRDKYSSFFKSTVTG